MSGNKKTTDPLISVIIPIYNCEAYIVKCLTSVTGNTYQNLEIICVDDGSTDRSLDILREHAALDSRIRIIRKENGGVSTARNAALERASGDFISFIDADDWVHHCFFQLLIREMDDQCDVVYCDLQNFIDPINEIVVNEPAVTSYTVKEAMSIRNAFTYVACRLYRASCLNGHTFDSSLRRSEDILFNYMVLPNCRKIKHLELKLYYRCVRNESLIHTRDAKAEIPVMRAFVALAEKENKPDTILLRRAYRSILSGRYKNNIDRESDVYPDLTDLIIRLKRQGKRFPFHARLFYNTLLDYPGLFRVLSNFRKRLKKR